MLCGAPQCTHARTFWSCPRRMSVSRNLGENSRWYLNHQRHTNIPWFRDWIAVYSHALQCWEISELCYTIIQMHCYAYLSYYGVFMAQNLFSICLIVICESTQTIRFILWMSSSLLCCLIIMILTYVYTCVILIDTKCDIYNSIIYFQNCFLVSLFSKGF